MATLNRASKELVCKIVYYGPGWGGKTTNLQKIHANLPKGAAGDLTSLATREDRTLFFDLLPVDMGKIGDYYVKVQLYTVPGQVHYDATRNVVLRGVDGIVMVFDSDPSREDANYTSLSKLEENLATYGLKPADMPTVYQYNKRDLPKAMDLRFMRESLNPEGRFPDMEAIACDGVGVMETVKKICSLVFERLEKQVSSRDKTATGSRPPFKSGGGTATRPPLRRARTESPATDSKVTETVAPARSFHRPFRLHQFCDVRMAGVSVGHALVELFKMEEAADGPDLTATFEVHRLVGSQRTETAQFWKASENSDEMGKTELYETRNASARKARKLWLVRGKDHSAQIFVDWKSKLGVMRIVPEGVTGGPTRHA